MKLILMPAVIPWGSTTSCQYLTTCLVNDRIAIDAGTLGFHGTPEQQAGIDHIFLTHSHLDHLASLPIFLENVYHLRKTPPVVYASRDVLEVLQRDLFNDRLWPDFITLSSRVRPFLRLEPILPGQTLTVEGVTVTAVPVTHVVPTMGFLLRSEAGTVAYVPDTGPTEAIWQAARARSDLRAVLVEATFPNEMAWLAEVSRHLTPLMLRDELSKLGREVPTYVMHLKAHYRREVRDELAMLGLGQLSLLEPGRVYEF